MSYELIFLVKKASLFFINFILHSYYGFCSTLKSWGWATNVGNFHTNAPVLIMRLVSRPPRECCRRSHLVSQAKEITAVCHCAAVYRVWWGGGGMVEERPLTAQKMPHPHLYQHIAAHCPHHQHYCRRSIGFTITEKAPTKHIKALSH